MGSDENTGSRFVGLFSPLTGLKLEFEYRYLANFGLGPRDSTATRVDQDSVSGAVRSWLIWKSSCSRNSAHGELQISARDDVDLLYRVDDFRFSKELLLSGPYRPVLLNVVCLVYRVVLGATKPARENSGFGVECYSVCGGSGTGLQDQTKQLPK